MSDYLRPNRALLSVFDKTNLIELGNALAVAGVEILSTGGTAKTLATAGVAVREVSQHTGFPEMLGGRVKTLHPKIHGGILALRDRAEHMQALHDHALDPIDIVAINLYPFEATIAGNADAKTAIEQIDIGGPAMIRSAAKNHAFVAVLTDPSDYAELIAELQAHGGTSARLRQKLAATAFARTAAYDNAIAAWFQERTNGFPFPRLAFGGSLLHALRYGENPHQPAAFYAGGKARPGVATSQQLQGKELSYNNLNDTDAAYELVAEFDQPAAVIVKHANPCGVALGIDLASAWKRALACDPASAFGGVVAVNRPLDAPTAAAISEQFIELVIAPAVSDEARSILAAKKNLRLLSAGTLPDPQASALTIKSLAGGFLVQGRDNGRITQEKTTLATRRAPTCQEWADLMFAFTVCKHVKSNAIVLARKGTVVGLSGGQTSRVDAARNAVRQAAETAERAGESVSRAVGAVVASDAFFPFPDGLSLCLEAGATAVIQPGGSLRDREVIAVADDKSAAMVFTGMRHFRH